MARLVDWRSLRKLNLLSIPSQGLNSLIYGKSTDSTLTGLLESELECYSRQCLAPSPFITLASSLGNPGMEAR